MSDTYKRKRTNNQTLYFARMLRGITVDEAANAVGLSTASLEKYEVDFGTTPLIIVLSLFRFYNIPYR
ncbi:helix-turn-helix domain-containing protein [Paenibacillus kribbensis]|uniref:helix-turn-helix domain-containing protein n=1 Tax=Paenibacillus kribbensis TaxID=172713 RepID=UPI0008386B4A|nr:helix-turn-helix transcriptional regulator [Paenibacillus kribbensis]